MSIHNYSELCPGLYENLVDEVLEAQIAEQKLDEVAVFGKLDENELPKAFSQYFSTRLEYLLSTVSKKEWPSIIASVLSSVSHVSSSDAHKEVSLKISAKNQLEYLAEIKERPDSAKTRRPATNLSNANLITNAPNDPSLEQELTSEFDSADQVDAVIAFIRASSMHTLYQQFQKLRDRGIPVRIITSTYTGSTERRVLDKLVREYGVQVKVSYNSERTRLHAKSWLIHRKTGFSTAYIGSSNLSKAAMQSGAEWNVRLTEANVPEVFSKFRSMFDSYWNSPEYELYEPDKDAEKFDEAIRRAKGYNTATALNDRSFIEEFSLLEVTPFEHQKIMLSELEAERENGHHRNLLVAATGTGKTVIAALDYKRLRERFMKNTGRSPRTLFVAHRQEILKQARKTFIDVVKVSNLGISTTDNFALNSLDSRLLAEHGNLVFASIQSLHSKTLEGFPNDFFDLIIIDEFHHASAPTYKKLIEHFAPQELLGLTATPERGDGTNVAVEFFSGRIASELRLWDALNADLLVPFHYFVNSDDTDLSKVRLSKGEYDVKSLNDLYVGNEHRADIIMRAIRDKVPSPDTMRAICFCASVEHANYMADCFNRVNLPAAAVTAKTENRDTHITALREGTLRVICAVDIFNEGVDIPEVDTLLMLRPTQSSTIFLQQLGRGLRRSFGKDLLTVLDFVGNQNKDFKFDAKFKVLSGNSRGRLIKSIEEGFTSLPPGVYVEFDKVSQDIVLKSLKRTLKPTMKNLSQELRELAQSTDLEVLRRFSLAEFLEFSNRELWDIYSLGVKHSVTDKTVRLTFDRLREYATTQKVTDREGAEISARIRSFTHVDDAERLAAYKFLLVGDYTSYAHLSERMKLYAHMLIFNVWPSGKTNGLRFTSPDEAITLLRKFPRIASEIVEVMEYRVDKSREVHRAPIGHLAKYPLFLDAKYTRNELLAAFKLGFEFKESKTGAFPCPETIREGVWSSPTENVDTLLVTLQKGESDIAYEDYAITENLFHWQSQNITSPQSPTGQRYMRHDELGWSIALFVRNSKKDEISDGAPYTFCGPTRFVSSEGSKPMSVTWALENPLSPQIYKQARAVAS